MTSPDRLVEILRDKHELPAEWAATVAAVDRAAFIPDRCHGLDRREDERRWPRTVYGDLPVVTQVDDGAPGGPGVPTSSSSMPSLMLEMLGLLAPRDGDDILEIGTATGYHAAWLCHRFGERHITTVEQDRDCHESARRNLRRAGFAPTAVLGDGLAGVPDRAPFHRIIATCTLRRVTPALLAQTADGGRIVAPFGGSFHSYSFLTLDVRDGVGQGRFSGDPAFMWARAHRGRTAAIQDVYHREKGEIGSTGADPLEIDADSDAEFFVSALVPGAWPVRERADDGSGEATYWLLSDDRRSWATVEYVPGHDRFETEQYGPRRLWDETESAYRRWVDLGRPPRDRFGLTATARGQRVWLDEPGRPID